MAVLVDTSVWVQHYRRTVPELAAMLIADEVATHAVVIGELAVGGLRNRTQTLADLRQLPLVLAMSSDQVLDFLEQHQLYNIGLSWGDVHLLSAAVLHTVSLWTFDTTLSQRAVVLGVAYTP